MDIVDMDMDMDLDMDMFMLDMDMDMLDIDMDMVDMDMDMEGLGPNCSSVDSILSFLKKSSSLSAFQLYQLVKLCIETSSNHNLISRTYSPQIVETVGHRREGCF